MTIPRSVAEILDEHTTLSLDSIDRLYLNLYVPMLQREPGIAHYWRRLRGFPFVSSALMAPMSHAFVKRIESFAESEAIDLIKFDNKQRKEDVAQQFLAQFEPEEGVLFIGKAQEKAKVVRTERRRNPSTGAPYPWLVLSSAMVNQYYFYCVDRDFGAFFIKFCSYFPYNGKLCLNGHEYLKRQLRREQIPFQAADNCILSCADPERMQQIADELNSEKIDALARKWFRKLPHAFSRNDRQLGLRYDISILQAEFATTHVLDRAHTGRVLFEQIIRDNLDLGRPDQVQLIFDRRITRRTDSQFRTRVITDGVIPSLYFNYKSNRIKQYHKLGEVDGSSSAALQGGLRTESTINDTYDFVIGRRLENLPALRRIGFKTNHRLLDVQRIGHDCSIGEAAFQQLQHPRQQDGQRVAGLRFGNLRVRALLSALVLFRLLPRGFTNQDLREHLAPLLGLAPRQFTRGKMTYDLRRLRLHRLIERIPKSKRYRVTSAGFRTALFLTRSYNRLLRPGLALIDPRAPPRPAALRDAIYLLDNAIEQLLSNAA
jgi:hypothetical protein